MATTKESIWDGIRWLRRQLVFWGKRAAVFGVLAGLFAVAVWVTRGTSHSDCGDVTEEQGAALASLASPSSARGVRAAGEPMCVDGVFAVPVGGLGNEMEKVTAELAAENWDLDGEFLPYFYNLWVRCFRSAEPGLDAIELTVASNRAGAVVAIEAAAPEGREPCERVRCATTTTGCVAGVRP